MGAGLILIPCFGALIFTHEVGSSDTIMLVIAIIGFIGLITILFKLNEILGYYAFITILTLLVFYAFNLWWILAIPVVVSFYLAIYIVGEYFGWWK